MFAVAGGNSIVVVALDPCASLGFETVAPDMASGPFTFSTVVVRVPCAPLKLHSVATDAPGPFAFGTAVFTGDAGGPPGADDVDGTSLMASVEQISLMQHSAIWPVCPAALKPKHRGALPSSTGTPVRFRVPSRGFPSCKTTLSWRLHQKIKTKHNTQPKELEVTSVKEVRTPRFHERHNQGDHDQYVHISPPYIPLESIK